MSRTPEVQDQIKVLVDGINQLFGSNPYNTNYGQIQEPERQQWFDSLTQGYHIYLPLVTYMKRNDIKPLMFEREACLQEIYLEFIKRNFKLDMVLANQILDTIFK